MSSNNLIIVGFDDEKINQICILLTNYLDLYFLYLEDLIEYSIMDKVKMNKLCGEEYLKKMENSVINSLSDYENSIINPGAERFISNKEKFEDVIKIYIRPKEKPKIKPLKYAIDEMQDILQKSCNIVLEDDENIDKIIEEIIENLRRL